MKLLRRLPKILKFIPGKAQDLRAWFLTMQYWLGGSDDNIEQMVRYLLGKYAATRPQWLGAEAAEPLEYPEVALYHPDLPGHHITTDPADITGPDAPVGTIGLLMLRSYILAGDTAHYDAVIRAFEAVDAAEAASNGTRHRPTAGKQGLGPGLVDPHPGLDAGAVGDDLGLADIVRPADDAFAEREPQREVLQIGRGIPQYRDRERFQSLAVESQFPKRPSPVAFGFQLISWLSSYIRSRTSVTLINQESRG